MLRLREFRIFEDHMTEVYSARESGKMTNDLTRIVAFVKSKTTTEARG